MSYITNEEGKRLWDANSEFNEVELAVINLAGVTVPKLRDFYSRFPEQNLDSAIGGCIMEMQQGLKQAQSIEDQKSQDATEPEA